MTPENPVVKDLVIPLEQFPHLHEHQTLHDAVEALNSYTSGGDDRLGFADLLILNDKNQLSGRVRLADVLLSLDPRLKEITKAGEFEGKGPEIADLIILWEDSFFVECKKWPHIPIKNVMSPIKHVVKGSDPALKALAIMLKTKDGVLPVTEGSRVIGVIRMKEIFKAITTTCRI